MKTILVAVKDNAIQAFLNIETVRAEGEALRAFMDAINNTNNKKLYDHPEDFDLYVIGYFDDQDGRVEREQPVRLLLRGVQAKRT